MNSHVKALKFSNAVFLLQDHGQVEKFKLACSREGCNIHIIPRSDPAFMNAHLRIGRRIEYWRTARVEPAGSSKFGRWAIVLMLICG